MFYKTILTLYHVSTSSSGWSYSNRLCFTNDCVLYLKSNPTISLRIGIYFSTHAFQTVTDSYAIWAYDGYVNVRQSICKLLHGIQYLVPAECWFDVFCVWDLFSDPVVCNIASMAFYAYTFYKPCQVWWNAPLLGSFLYFKFFAIVPVEFSDDEDIREIVIGLSSDIDALRVCVGVLMPFLWISLKPGYYHDIMGMTFSIHVKCRYVCRSKHV